MLLYGGLGKKPDLTFFRLVGSVLRIPKTLVCMKVYKTCLLTLYMCVELNEPKY